MLSAILLEDGFESTEALTTRDILLRSHLLDVLTVSTAGKEMVTSSDHLAVKVDAKINDVDWDKVDFIILPGGKKGVENLKANKSVLSLLLRFHALGKPIYAICAAPSILNELGFLEGVAYTCYPGFEKGGEYTKAPVSVDKGQITGKAMAYSIDFALAILAKHLGQNVADEVIRKARGE